MQLLILMITSNILSNQRNCANCKKCYIFFPPRQIAHWDKLFMAVHVILQMFNQIRKLQNTLFVFSEVAEDCLVSIGLTKSIPSVSPLCSNHCWVYSIYRADDTCMAVEQDDNPQLHEIYIKRCSFVGFWKLLMVMTKSALYLIPHIFNTSA